MISRFLAFWGLLLLATSLWAEPLKFENLTVGARTFHKVTVLGASSTDLYFTHSEGIANVKLKHLSPELQKMFNYDSATAAAAERRQAEDDSLYQQKLASQIASNSLANSTAASTNRRTSEQSLADPVSDQSLLGKQAPPLDVEKWSGEKPALDGKCLLITFWAPWSAACRKSLPNLNALQKKFGEKLVVIRLNSEAAEPDPGTTEPDPQLVSGLDTKARLRNAAGITSVPCVLLLDSKGVVRYQGHPAALNEKTVQALLGKALE